MSAAEKAHRSAGWAGILIAVVGLAENYLARDTARLQAAQTAALAKVEAVDEMAAELRKLAARIDMLEGRAAVPSMRDARGVKGEAPDSPTPISRSLVLPEPATKAARVRAAAQQYLQEPMQ